MLSVNTMHNFVKLVGEFRRNCSKWLHELKDLGFYPIEALHRPKTLKCSMIVRAPGNNNTIGIGEFQSSCTCHSLRRSSIESTIHTPACIGALLSTLWYWASKPRICWWHVIQIMDLTAFSMTGLPTTSAAACCKKSDLKIFVAASWATARHTATMWEIKSV